MPRYALIVGLCLPLSVGGLSCAAGSVHTAEGQAALKRANYEQAFKAYSAALQEEPGNEQLAKEVESVRILWLRDLARKLVFDNREEEALEVLDRIIAMRPDDAAALQWRTKAREKLATRAAGAGRDAFRGGDLETALREFHKAMQFCPAWPDAEAGIKDVALEHDRRRKKADDHYLEGIRALAERLFGQTYYHMFNSLQNDPDRSDAARKKTLAIRQLMQKRFDDARAAETRKSWRAALVEYRYVKSQVADFPGIDERIAAMETEVAADELATQAELMIVRHDFDQAIATLKKGLDMTRQDRLRLSELLASVREKQVELRFRRAKDFEFDGRLDAAVAAYREIEKDMPGYSSVRARIANLEETLKLVAEAYRVGVEAQAAGDRAKAIASFSEVLMSVPDFRDARERLETLKADVKPGGQDGEPSSRRAARATDG